MSELYLQHHGVKGMKWGVRRYRNRDGTLTKEGRDRYSDDIVYKKGTDFQHITTESRLKLGKKQTYVSNDEWDKQVYRGAYAIEIAMKKNTPLVFNKTFRSTEDLVSPSEKKRIDLFVDIYKKNPVKADKELQSVKKLLLRPEDFSYEGGNPKKLSDDEIKKRYKLFNAIYGNQDLYRNGKTYLAKQYTKEVLKQGYNALIDDNDRGSYGNTVAPLIVLNGKRSLKEISSTQLMPADMTKDRNYVLNKIQEK